MNSSDPLTEMTIADLDRKLVQMRDELRAELRSYVDEHFVRRADFESRLTRLTFEVVREVSSKLQAMVRDAMHEVASETVETLVVSDRFAQRIHEVLDNRRTQDRAERVEDFRKAIGTVGRLVAFVNPLLSMLLALIAIWAVFIR
jgi:hypothetical protein